MVIMANIACSLAVVFVLIVEKAHGSTITVDSSTTEIHANLTPNLILTCVVNESSPISGGIVGRDVTHKAKADVEFVTSLVVMRNGKHVASVTEHTPAHAVLDLNNIKVTGSMSGTSGVLQLTWQYPDDAQVGEYTCEANGITLEGHNAMLTETVEVTLVEPELKDLVQYIHNQQVQITDLKNENQGQTLQIQGLNNSVGHLKNVQTGAIDCGVSTQWTSRVKNRYGGNDAYTTITHQFQTAYDKPPVVFLSMEHFYHAAGQAGYYFIQVDSVTANNVTIRCQAHTATTYKIERMQATWLSIPH